jgi:hypothetical protein
MLHLRYFGVVAPIPTVVLCGALCSHVCDSPFSQRVRSEVFWRRVVDLARLLQLVPYGPPGQYHYVPIAFAETEQFIPASPAAVDPPARNIMLESGLHERSASDQLGLHHDFAL